MAIEELIQAVEVGAKERIHEIRERSKSEAEEIVSEANTKGGPIKKRYLEEAMRSVELQKNKLLSETREESRMEVIKTKNEIFQKTFENAAKVLGSVREHARYRKSFSLFITEVSDALGEEDIILHIDPRDEALCREILNELKMKYEIVTDLTCAGGLNAHTRNGRFVVLNTLESRIQKAKELHRPVIFSMLFG